mmetsp:Transcript_3082/g.9370  ORF Transcript_3082/g.9370 Transcript_3082/m.9370 type:complete len:107 (+) Transcript_3082:324-644(+)
MCARSKEDGVPNVGRKEIQAPRLLSSIHDADGIYSLHGDKLRRITILFHVGVLALDEAAESHGSNLLCSASRSRMIHVFILHFFGVFGVVLITVLHHHFLNSISEF